MIGYVIRRTLVAILITVGIAAITFELLHLISGSPVHEVLGRGAKPAQIAAWNKQHGYDRPLPAQFLTYLGKLGHLNFGYSYKQGQSVNTLFAQNAGRSIYLSGTSLVLSLLIAIPIGIAQAVRRNSFGD
jgi:peptide/nickel transport system permease protein